MAAMAEGNGRKAILKIRGLSRLSTASRTPSRASTSPSATASCRSSAGTAWARPRSATPSSASRRCGAARSASPARRSPGSTRTSSPGSASATSRRGGGYGGASPSTSISASPRAASDGAWTIDRVYETFPRLAERRTNRGSQLSGGEQQMLAIGRALLGNPRLLIMDEPTEGLAPIIVDHLVETLGRIGEDNDMSVLLIEQNIGVATTVAEHVAIMVNGRIHRVCRRASWPPTATCSSASSASAVTPTSPRRKTRPVEPGRNRGAGRRGLPGRCAAAAMARSGSPRRPATSGRSARCPTAGR